MSFSLGADRFTSGRQCRTLIIFVTLAIGLGLVVAFYRPATPSMAVVTLPVTPISTTQDDLLLVPDFQQVNLFAKIESDSPRNFVLSRHDQTLYRQIFDAQSQGDWSRANALMKRLHDRVLVGQVMYDRYMNDAGYKANYEELRTWMQTYGDHPDAYKIYQLAQKRRQNDPAALPAPQMAKKLLGSLELTWFTKKAAPQSHSTRRVDSDVRRLMQDTKKHLTNGDVTAAYDHLGAAKAARMLTAVEYDSLLGEIAAGYYYAGKYAAALRIANQATNRSDKAVPVAHWIAGLSAWQKDDFTQAANHFTAINKAYNRNPWMLSAAAFWAARAHEKLGQTDTQNDWLREAASYPRTFYGLIAQNALGKNASFSWDAPKLTDSLVEALRTAPSGIRALALLDIDQKIVAEKELRQIHPNGNQRLEKALVAVAAHFNLSNLAMRLGNAVNQPDGKLYDSALYPMIPWKGDQATGIDPALINALVRQESKFDPEARNGRSGAKGLMQLMPDTARFMSHSDHEANRLHDPETNIVLGQRYVRYLLDMPQVDNNLLYMAAAYNAGPRTLDRWKKEISYKNDPFLFIESLPMSETRGFVARVMTNYWIYAQRLSQTNDSLQALSDNSWPVYSGSATGGMKLVSY